jgi:hypothetical protein
MLTKRHRNRGWFGGRGISRCGWEEKYAKGRVADMKNNIKGMSKD